MEARAKMMGHPVHQMFIVFPLGLLGMSVIFDFVYFGTDDMLFSVVAYWMMVAGIVGGLVAAPFGLIDWSAIPRGTRAKRIGAMHGLGNVIVLLLFLGSVLLRDGAEAPPPTAAYVCSFLGVLLSLATAWLGGELVDRLGVGVHDGANLDAPSSLAHTGARHPSRMP
ncbi:MAG TPA: DUF2231 domain-containing protein [Steroidobacteraceae bacterium]